MHPALGLLIAYVAGSFPSAYLAGRMIKGIDLRTVGSGNLGATNVYRNLGTAAALTVLVLDLAKGRAAGAIPAAHARRRCGGERPGALVGARVRHRGNRGPREAGVSPLEGRRQGRRDRDRRLPRARAERDARDHRGMRRRRLVFGRTCRSARSRRPCSFRCSCGSTAAFRPCSGAGCSWRRSSAGRTGRTSVRLRKGTEPRLFPRSGSAP